MQYLEGRKYIIQGIFLVVALTFLFSQLDRPRPLKEAEILL